MKNADIYAANQRVTRDSRTCANDFGLLLLQKRGAIR